MGESGAKASGAEESVIAAAQFDALLFDLDGVVTQSMKIHAAAWKLLFDSYLRGLPRKDGEEVVLFDKDTDYRAFVDGKTRYEGVNSFLQSRGISLPMGEPTDEPSLETVCGLGNKKNQYFQKQLNRQPVEVYGSSVLLIRKARAMGIKTAVVSSSRNCKRIVDSVGIADLFETRVDGIEVERLGLKGKPAPDMFIEAARRLEVKPARAVVFEDAISGVQAGRAGGFGLVVGVDRTGHPQDLLQHGAHIVVGDLAELTLE
ncbi:MAG: beta-phosphoglucomutase family hydrolase [bacterium]